MWPSGKAPLFGSGMRRFESCHPSHFISLPAHPENFRPQAPPCAAFAVIRFSDTCRELQFHPIYSPFSLQPFLARVGWVVSLLNREITGNMQGLYRLKNFKTAEYCCSYVGLRVILAQRNIFERHAIKMLITPDYTLHQFL